MKISGFSSALLTLAVACVFCTSPTAAFDPAVVQKVKKWSRVQSRCAIPHGHIQDEIEYQVEDRKFRWIREFVGMDYLPLGGMDLSRTDLSNAPLRYSILVDAKFRRANLRGANLSNSYLMFAIFTGADLRGANLTASYLAGADLTGADLRGADLQKADLRWAKLKGADLRGVIAGGAQGLSTKSDGACGDHATQLPVGVKIRQCAD